MAQGRNLAVAVLLLVVAVVVWIVMSGGPRDEVVGGGAADGGDAPLAVAEAPVAPPPPAASGGGVERREQESVPSEPESDAEGAAGLTAVGFFGRVVAAETGEPLAGCEVELHGWGVRDAVQAEAPDFEWQDPDPVVTDADGVFAFEFEDLSARQYGLWVKGAGRVTRYKAWSARADAPRVRDLGDVELVAGVVVRGRVVDEAGQPVAGGDVHLNGIPGVDLENPGRTGSAFARSGEDGGFEFESALPVGNWPVDVRKDGYLYAGEGVLEVPEVPGPVEVVLRLKAAPRVSGWVRLPDGSPVASARVEAEDDVSGWMATDRTAEDGSFRIHATNEKREAFPLSVEGAGIEPLITEERYEWGQAGIVVTVMPALALELTVVEAGSGVPVTDYAVKCHVEDARSSTERELRLGGEHADGLLTIGGIARGANLLTVVPGDPALQVAGPIRFTATDAGVEPMTVEVERMQPLQVRVVRPGGEAVADAKVDAIDRPMEDPRQTALSPRDGRVQVYGSGLERYPVVLATASTSADGFATLHWPPDLVEGTVRVESEGRVSLHPVVRPLDAAQPLELVIGGIGRVRGTLRHPLAGSGKVRLVAAEDRPGSWLSVELDLDEAGGFEAELPTGEYRLTLTQFVTHSSATSSSNRWRSLEPDLAHFVIEHGRTTELDVDGSAMAFGSLQGKVTLDGEPYLGVLRLNRRPGVENPRSWGLHSTVRTDSQGRFTAVELPPGLWTVGLTVTLAGGEEYHLFHPTAVDLGPGSTETRDFAFVRRDMTLRILHPDSGAPLAGLEFRLPRDPGPEPRYRTDADGRVFLDNVPMTPFRLFTWLEDGSRLVVGPVTPPTGESESVVEITATRRE